MVPVRSAVLGLAATSKVTVPLPDPLAPPVIVIQPALLAAVHEQLLPVVMLTEPVPPVEGADPLVDPSVKVQGAPDCVTVNVWPPAVMVPVREELVVLAATL
jgi:hypothetical protein